MWLGQRHRKPGTCRQHRLRVDRFRHPVRYRCFLAGFRHAGLDGRLHRQEPRSQRAVLADGSGAGRKAFLDGRRQFAGSDAYLDDEEWSRPRSCGPDGAMDIPVYISPIAVAFNLEGITELNMDAETIAKVFRGEIAKWNDPAIAAQNPGVELPDTAITVVHRSDDSGTTENFTEYLAAAAGEVWTDKAPATGPPAAGRERQGHLRRGQDRHRHPGAITYADASAVGGKLGTVKVKVGNEYVEL